MMVLSRKANDQNRTILVICSNHRPTSFGIITLFVIRVSFFYPTLYLASLTLLRSPKRLSNDETISRRMAT